MPSPKKTPAVAEPKHRATFEFRGLTYRYNKTYGEWRLVGFKKAPHHIPDTIMSGTSRTTQGPQSYWCAGGVSGATPQQVLEKWAQSLIALRKREAREAERNAKECWAVVRKLEASSWKPRA